jgi:hypothetical protein
MSFGRHHLRGFAGRGLGTVELADMRVTGPSSLEISSAIAEQSNLPSETSSVSHAVTSPFRLLRRPRTKERSAARRELWMAPDHPPSLECLRHDLLEPQLHSTNGQCAHPGPHACMTRRLCETVLSDWRGQFDASMCSLMRPDRLSEETSVTEQDVKTYEGR